MPTDQRQFVEETLHSSKTKLHKRYGLFKDEITESLGVDILRYVGEVDGKVLERFVSSVYGLSMLVGDVENRLSFERKIEKYLRTSRRRFTSARKHLRICLAEFSKAQQILREEMSEVLPGTLRFREVRAGLEKLSKAVTELEADGSALIHFQLRTDTEKAFAQTSKIRRRAESRYPASQKSAKITHDAIAMLDKVIMRFDTKRKIPSNHIDRFICRFFAVAKGVNVEEESIKTTRNRLKKRRTQPRLAESSSAPFTV